MSALKAIRLYKYTRAALASVTGLAFLVLGLYQTSRFGARGSDVIWYFLVFAVGQFFAFRAYRRTRDAADEETFDELVAKREAKLAEKRAVKGPVLGKLCDQCKQRIVVEHDGLRCAQCSAPIHCDCRKAHVAEHGTRVGAYR
jgi:hypothetical protein